MVPYHEFRARAQTVTSCSGSESTYSSVNAKIIFRLSETENSFSSSVNYLRTLYCLIHLVANTFRLLLKPCYENMENTFVPSRIGNYTSANPSNDFLCWQKGAHCINGWVNNALFILKTSCHPKRTKLGSNLPIYVTSRTARKSKFNWL